MRPGLQQDAWTLIFVFSLCNGMGNPLLALHNAVDDLQMVGHKIKVRKTFIFETVEDCNKMCKAALQTIQYQGTVEFCGDLINFPDKVYELPRMLNAHTQFFIVVLSGTPCKSISLGCRMNKNRRHFGLHAAPSNLWWTAQRGMANIEVLFPSKLVTFIENVQPVLKDLQELDQTAGCRYSMCVPTNAGNPRKRFLWTNWQVRFAEYSSMSHVTDFKGRPWLGKHLQYMSPSHTLPCLRAIFPKLFWQHAEGDPDLSPQDAATVQQCRIWKEDVEEEVLPPLITWATFLGLPSEILASMQHVLPCKSNIVVWNKGVRKEYYCSAVAYCENCSIILSALGESWHVDVTTFHLSSLLLQFQEFHKHNPDSRPFQYTKFCPHYCTSTCPLSRTTL